jgi:hypothetical protein
MVRNVERIDISDKRTAQRQVEDYFTSYPRLPRAIIACPGGVYRSERISIYLEAKKLAICPFNVKVLGDNVKYAGISFRDLVFGGRQQLIDTVVLCNDREAGGNTDRQDRVIDEIGEKKPILVLEGMEGHFTYFCSDVGIY